jgi:NAD-dependent SIR2 family protein deacetylase
MKFGTVDIPNSLLDDLHNNKVVLFAGAGVSIGEPACFPNFKSLTKIIAKGTGEAKSKSENLEQFLGRLDDRGVEVHHLAKTQLSREGAKPTPLHRDLLKLYRKDQSIRLVTTNFDLLFEQAAKEISGNTPEVFHAPMLPFGHQLNGIIHLHGSICYPDQMVLTDRDFGRAYLREAWATRFLLDLYDKYTFLFIGYSAFAFEKHLSEYSGYG